MTTSTDEILVIDISTSDTNGSVAAIGDACQDWGFFRVINHGVPVEKRDKVKTEAKKFFGLSMEEKRKVRRNEANPLGYYDSEHTKNVRDWKELFDFNAFDPVLVPALSDSDDGVLDLSGPNFRRIHILTILASFWIFYFFVNL